MDLPQMTPVGWQHAWEFARSQEPFCPDTGELCLVRRAYGIFAANVGPAGCWLRM